MRCELLHEDVVLDAVVLPLAVNRQTSGFIAATYRGTDTSELPGSVRCTAVETGRFTDIALEVGPGNRIFTALPVVEVQETMSRE